MKRPEGMPFYAYRMALAKLNHRIEGHLRGEVVWRGKPYVSTDNALPKVKPLALAVRHALI